MTDLTDSYCERCGARYVFSPPAPKTMSLKGARVLAKGLKNFVMTDGQSMADSLTLARHEDGHQDSTRITEAFHKTFNFCMTCRQYACEKCWNARAGACLSCSPEEGLEPVAREDHLLVRTPVARWDMDWSLFPDGPDAEPLNKPAPLPFDAPIQFSEAAPAEPAEAAAPEAWPVADHLPAPDPAGTSGRLDNASHRAAGRAVDPMAASLWPMADELSPEMTLTPEELELVETGLSHGEFRPEQAVDEDTETVAMPAMESVPEPEVQFASAPEPELVPVMETEPAPEPQPQFYRVTTPAPVLPVAPAVPPAAPEPAPSAWTSAGAAQTPVTPWPRATAWSERPIEAHDWRNDRSGSAEPPEPLPAAAAEMPIYEQAPALDPASQIVAPQPAAPTTAEAAQGVGLPAPDARSAAAMRLSAVPAEQGEPVQLLPATPETQPAEAPAQAQAPAPAPAASETQAAAPDPTPAPAPAPTPAQRESSPWLSAPDQPRERPEPPTQPQLFDMPAAQPAQPQASGPDAIGRRTPAAPWQPLGSSWPAGQDPRAPWPGPQVPAALPAVAAQQASASTVTAMWAQSSQEVLNRGTVRVCHRCALPVSTHARFCRRCGTPQT